MIDSRKPLKLAVALLVSAASRLHAEDGSRLWLRYEGANAAMRRSYARQVSELVVNAQGLAANAAASELKRALPKLIGTRVRLRPSVDCDGAIVLALQNAPSVQGLHLKTVDLGSEGFLIQSVRVNGHRATLVTANADAGLLYGAFALLRRLQENEPIQNLRIRDRPILSLRILNHWDNLDRSVERGYAGQSLWDWQALPGTKDTRYVDYARANASIGINGTVLNNVNADPRILTDEYLHKVANLADRFRPYAVRTYLAVRFSSPIEVGGLKTADPADPTVQAWWRGKVDEIYRLIPDFGGFVVKANVEGQPGPQDYHRTHADGANVIADALRPHGGTVFWRAFVYGNSSQDRAMQAYDEFRPLDGKFRDNVVLQVKNGPIDFQPREPFHPLFGQMPHTRVAMEVQITREYLGQNTGVVYLGPMWTEVLNADTCAPRCGTPVLEALGAMAGVSNAGTAQDWTGAIFDQANWYAFGRLAWNPRLSARNIADEWVKMTWSINPHAVRSIVSMMTSSRETVVNFMTPLGLAHQMATDHHYGPAPWVCDLKQASWNPCYYNRADKHGIGVDRASGIKGANGTPPNAISEYMPRVATRFARLGTVPAKFILWFHHLPWNYRMASGRTLWTELVLHYDDGVAAVGRMQRSWRSVKPEVDAERWASVAADLQREQLEAKWWRNASIAYFQRLANRPLPKGSSMPPHSLTYYQTLRAPPLPGQRR